MLLPEFRAKLLAWYDRARRAMPWRETRDPYAILVSELMLQQTQVKTVIPYFERFMTRFPTAADLAEAPEEVLLKQWQGLGYYRRARNLQLAARQIVEEHSGNFPREKEAIDALRGVGPYTSAAVASIAFDLPYACVDGNVIRVISRLDALDDDTAATPVRKMIAGRAQDLLDVARAGDFNQAMMELGAVICTPRNPGCLTCPVEEHCQTRQRGDDPHQRPFKSKRVKASKAFFESLFLFCGDRVMMARRPEEGLMAGMWELPSQDIGDFTPWPDAIDGEVVPVARLEPVVHRFTHLHATYRVQAFRCEGPMSWAREPNAYRETAWLDLDQIDQLPQTKVFSRLLPELKSIMKGDPACQLSVSNLPGM